MQDYVVFFFGNDPDEDLFGASGFTKRADQQECEQATGFGVLELLAEAALICG